MRINDTQNQINFKGRFSVLVETGNSAGHELAQKVTRGITKGSTVRSIPSHICSLSSCNERGFVIPVITGKADYAEFCNSGQRNLDAFFSGAPKLNANELIKAMQERRFNYQEGTILDAPIKPSLYLKTRGVVYDACQWILGKLTH